MARKKPAVAPAVAKEVTQDAADPVVAKTFRVSGISALKRDMEIIRCIRKVILPIFTEDMEIRP